MSCASSPTVSSRLSVLWVSSWKEVDTAQALLSDPRGPPGTVTKPLSAVGHEFGAFGSIPIRNATSVGRRYGAKMSLLQSCTVVADCEGFVWPGAGAPA